MLEIAGGILLAAVILIFVLANIGWIVLGLSILATAGLAAVGTVVLMALPSDFRNAALIVAVGLVVIFAFGYWTQVDRRFLIPDDRPGKDKTK